MLNEAIEELKEKVGKDSMIYLTGSQLTGVSNNHSDFDFYAFYLPTKSDFIFRNNDRGRTYHGSNWEAKVFPIAHILNLIIRSNPNVLEFLTRKPLYVFPNKLRLFSDYVYEHREQLFTVDENHFLGACRGMMKENERNLLNRERVYNGSGSFGKELYNFEKSYRYGFAIGHHKSFEDEVYLKGAKLEEQRKLKSSTYSKELIDKMKIQDKLDEMSNLIEQTPEKSDETIQSEVAPFIDRLPIFKN